MWLVNVPLYLAALTELLWSQLHPNRLHELLGLKCWIKRSPDLQVLPQSWPALQTRRGIGMSKLVIMAPEKTSMKWAAACKADEINRTTKCYILLESQ
jgi:hypothetical protein